MAAIEKVEDEFATAGTGVCARCDGLCFPVRGGKAVDLLRGDLRPLVERTAAARERGEREGCHVAGPGGHRGGVGAARVRLAAGRGSCPRSTDTDAHGTRVIAASPGPQACRRRENSPMETGLPPGHRRCRGGSQRRIPLLLCALVAATLVLACAPGCGSPRTPAFHAEVDTAVPPELDPLSRLGISERRILTRWWYDPDPFRWRWEVEIRGSIIDDGTVVTVVNGDDYWEYDDRSKSVRRGLMRVVPDEIMLLPTYNASVGPVRARTVDSLIGQLRESGDYSEVGLHGEATVLGRTTRVVGFRSPAYGVVRAWVDPERMFIMRWAGELEGSGGAYASEVTALEYDTDHDERTFSVDPPAGARADAMCDASTYPMVGVSGGAPSLPRSPASLCPRTRPAATVPSRPGPRSMRGAAAGRSPSGRCSKPRTAPTSC